MAERKTIAADAAETAGATGTPAESGDPQRRTGRPRSESSTKAILDATVELLVEVGFNSLTLEEVAARAKVGKSTIYRWWPSKLELVIDALQAFYEQLPVPDTGNVREDLLGFYNTLITVLTKTLLGRVMPSFIGWAGDNAEFARVFRDTFVAPRRAAAVQVVEKAIAHGDLKPDTDAEALVDALVGSVYYRRLVLGRALEPELAKHVVDLLLDGARLPRQEGLATPQGTQGRSNKKELTMSLPVEDVLAIYQLYARYAHTIDSGDAEGWASCFAADGSYRSINTNKYTGAQALTDFARAIHAANKAAGIRTRHWMANHLFEEPGPDGVRAKVHLMLLGIKPEGSIRILATGFYHDHLVKDAQGWRFQSRSDEPDREWRGFEVELSF